MRESLESEEDDVHKSQDKRRRVDTSWCVRGCCVLFPLDPQNSPRLRLEEQLGSLGNKNNSLFPLGPVN